jgi:hypothetical protein
VKGQNIDPKQTLIAIIAMAAGPEQHGAFLYYL